MINKEWHYINGKNDSGFLSLQEVIHKFGDDSWTDQTYLRHQNWIYWKPIRKCSEIIAHFTWDYIDEKNTLQKHLFGYELAAKWLKKEITDKTLVRLQDGPFVSFKDSFLIPSKERTYAGFTSERHNIATSAEPIVLFFAAFALSVWFTSSFFRSPSKDIFLLLVLALDHFFIFLHSYFIHKKGYSLYSKLFGYSLLNYDGAKLSLPVAFWRHFTLKTSLEEFDKDRGVILLKEKCGRQKPSASV